MAEELNIRTELFPPFKEGGPNHMLDRKDAVGMIADAVAEEKSTRAAASGAWEKAAQPGFEEQVQTIQDDAELDMRVDEQVKLDS